MRSIIVSESESGVRIYKPEGAPKPCGINSLESIPGLLKRLRIRARESIR
jgi:hypothetical protein